MLSKERKGELAVKALQDKKDRAEQLTFFDMAPLALVAIMTIGAIVLLT